MNIITMMITKMKIMTIIMKMTMLLKKIVKVYF